MKDQKGDLYISDGRLPCEQPYQRMLVTYDGKFMCCYDWGKYTLWVVDKAGFEKGDTDNLGKENIENKKKGFELMKPILPHKFNTPKEKVEKLDKIWIGSEIEVRINMVNK